VLRLVPALRIQLGMHLENVRTVIRNFGPVFVSRGVVQLSAFIDTIIASYLPTGAAVALANAQTIYLLPVSLFGMSVTASELPEMSRAVGAGADFAANLRLRLVTGLRKISFFVVPSVVAFIAFGDVIAGAIYQSGKFTHADTVWEWGILVGSGVGLLASTQGRLYSSAFYALQDTRTPLRFAVIRIGLTTVLGYLCAVPLPPMLGVDPKWGVAGLTASAGVSGWVEFFLLRRALSSRIGSEAVGAKYLTRLWASAIVAAGLGWAIKEFTIGLHPKVLAGVVLLPFGTLYLLLAEGANAGKRLKSLVRR
jgi:putative peptidoglycan lipid II flippase